MPAIIFSDDVPNIDLVGRFFTSSHDYGNLVMEVFCPDMLLPEKSMIVRPVAYRDRFYPMNADVVRGWCKQFTKDVDTASEMVLVEVEYDLTYAGGDYSDVGDKVRFHVRPGGELEHHVPLWFQIAVKADSCHIVHWKLVNEEVVDYSLIIRCMDSDGVESESSFDMPAGGEMVHDLAVDTTWTSGLGDGCLSKEWQISIAGQESSYFKFDQSALLDLEYEEIGEYIYNWFTDRFNASHRPVDDNHGGFLQEECYACVQGRRSCPYHD